MALRGIYKNPGIVDNPVSTVQLGEEEEVASTERVEMLSRPQQLTVTTGDKMVLPCRVQAEGGVITGILLQFDTPVSV